MGSGAQRDDARDGPGNQQIGGIAMNEYEDHVNDAIERLGFTLERAQTHGSPTMSTVERQTYDLYGGWESGAKAVQELRRDTLAKLIAQCGEVGQSPIGTELRCDRTFRHLTDHSDKGWSWPNDLTPKPKPQSNGAHGNKTPVWPRKP